MKKDSFYFNNLCDCVEYSYRAAQFLEQTVAAFSIQEIREKIDMMHEMEQGADARKHEMMAALNKAFITPIEREDLVDLSNNLDDITDAIEEVLLQIYMCNVTDIREDILPTIDFLIMCIRCLWDVLKEFPNFKTSSTIAEHIVRVNDLEEKGDNLYMENMYQLHQEQDVKVIVTWRKIYECIEACFDTCEHAADIVEMVIMKNS